MLYSATVSGGTPSDGWYFPITFGVGSIAQKSNGDLIAVSETSGYNLVKLTDSGSSCELDIIPNNISEYLLEAICINSLGDIYVTGYLSGSQYSKKIFKQTLGVGDFNEVADLSSRTIISCIGMASQNDDIYYFNYYDLYETPRCDYLKQTNSTGSFNEINEFNNGAAGSYEYNNNSISNNSNGDLYLLNIDYYSTFPVRIHDLRIKTNGSSSFVRQNETFVGGVLSRVFTCSNTDNVYKIDGSGSTALKIYKKINGIGDWVDLEVTENRYYINMFELVNGDLISLAYVGGYHLYIMRSDESDFTLWR